MNENESIENSEESEELFNFDTITFKDIIESFSYAKNEIITDIVVKNDMVPVISKPLNLTEQIHVAKNLLYATKKGHSTNETITFTKESCASPEKLVFSSPETQIPGIKSNKDRPYNIQFFIIAMENEIESYAINSDHK